MVGDEFLLLSDEALERLGLTGPEIVDAIEAAILDEAAGKILTTPKSVLVPPGGRYTMATLSTGDDPALTIVKSVMVSPRNPDRGRPGVDGSILIQDSETGQMRALAEAGWITGVRTAGLSAVAARRLANPAASSIAFVGCGVQARSHLALFAELFPLTEIRAVGRGKANIERLCDMATGMGLAARAISDPEEAMRGADIVVSSVTLSYEIEPFLDATWLKPGAFAAITDLALPWAQESMAAIGPLFVDNLVQEEASPSKLVAPELIDGDLISLLRDGVGDISSSAARAFVFRGIAIGDYAIARLAYERAAKLGVGQSVRW